MTPKHIIILEHIWGIPRLYPQMGSSTHSVRTCDRCGSTQRILQLNTSHDQRSIEELAESTDPDDRKSVVASAEAIANNLRPIVDYLLSKEEELCEGTAYKNLLEFAGRLKRRHQGAVGDNDLTFEIAEHIINTNNGKTGSKHTRKVLLAFKQGLVCDICDQEVDSLDDLTEDHILPRTFGGESTLMNLRLTHWSCNDNKGDKLPTASDISPFAYKGEPCKHRVNCVKEESPRGLQLTDN